MELNKGIQGNFKAFTLIELLAVVAIIGTLAALLVPAGLRMIHSGKETKALGVMRNTLRCAGLAQADNGGIYYRKMIPSVGRYYWMQYFVSEYCDFNPQALRSPLDDEWDTRLKTLNYPLAPSDKKTGFSYAMNIDLPATYPDIDKEPSLYYINGTKVESASRAALFFEGMGTLAGVRKKSDLKKHLRFGYKNGSGVAVGFLDSHIEIVPKADILEDPTSTWSVEDRNIFWTGNPSSPNS